MRFTPATLMLAVTLLAAPAFAETTREFTLPAGTFVRAGATARAEASAAGELTLQAGSVALVIKDNAPVTVVSGGERTTISGGTVLLTTRAGGALRLIVVAGPVTVTPAGAAPITLDAGQTTTVFPATGGGTRTASIATIDLDALAKSSRLLTGTPLPSSAAISAAAAAQRDAKADGDLVPTGTALVAASRERGLGFTTLHAVRVAQAQLGVGSVADNPAHQAAGHTNYIPSYGTVITSAADYTGGTAINMPSYGLVTGSGVLRINGTNTYVPSYGLTLIKSASSAANTYLGGTAITPGKLQITGATVEANGATLNAGTTTLYAANTYSGGSVTKVGAGTLTLSGNNTLSGATVEANGATLGTGTITLSPSGTGTLTLSGDNTYTGGNTLIGAVTFTVSSTTYGSATSSSPSTVALNGGTFTATPVGSFTLTNVTFTNSATATGGTVALVPTGPDDTRVSLDTVTFAPTHTLQANATTIALKNVTFDQGVLLSRDGVLNLGSVVDGAVNFVSGVKTSDNTDLTTAAGINAKVEVKTGTILQNGAPMAGATGAASGAPIVINKR